MKNLFFVVIFICLTFIPICFAISASNNEYTINIEKENDIIKIFKQDGNNTEKIFYPPDLFESADKNFSARENWEKAGLITNETPRMIAWNGEYFLMDNMFSLIKYDGEKFEQIRYGNGGYSASRIKRMNPIGDYWILKYVDAGTPNKIYKIFNGERVVFSLNTMSIIHFGFYIIPFVLFILIMLFVLNLMRDYSIIGKKKK